MNYKKMWSEVVTASLIIIISAIAIISFIVISDQDVDIYNPSSKIQVSKGTDKISEVLNLLQSKYMGELNIEELVDGALDGIFSKIDDPYTRYMTEEEYNEAVNSGGEEYVGIGVHISFMTTTKEAKIIGVMQNSPAKEVGIKAGDVIKKVDDTVIDAENYNKVADIIKGAENTIVNIEVERNGKRLTYSIQRKKIIANDVATNIIDKDIGYIKIFEFERGVYDSFKEEYNYMLKNDNIKGLIIDLRDNPGGFVDETVRIADFLCGSGTIIKEEYGDGTTRVYTSDKEKSEIPIVVLVNENSASASEILSGAIKDLKAGKLVGTKTFGKGITQSYIKLENGGGVAITVSKYYTASNTEIHGIGIMPDVEVKPGSNDIIDFSANAKSDTQLRKAIEVLNDMK